LFSHRNAFLCKLIRLLPLGFLLTLLVVSAASALEKFATYPSLPQGYSSIKVFDIHGRFVGRILPAQRYWVSIDRIPDFMKKALVAIEDSRFYEHNGIDVRGIARALVKDVVKGRLAEGGSTITQQLIKNRYLSGEKTLDRKVKEGLLAMEFERQYSKDQILEMYFNQINFGNGTWGIAQAARLYFDKNPEDLTDAECSLLAGVPKAPARYNPLGDPARVNMRRGLVLKRMLELKMITARKRAELIAHPAAVIRKGQALSYVDHIRNKLIERYGARIIEQGGLDVISAMDLDLQKFAEQALRDGVKKISPKLQGSLLCMDLATGDVLAAVGGVDFSKSAYNRAFFARRQPGSAIKPLIYAAALENGFTASTLMSDTPVSYNAGNNQTWTPLNYERRLYGKLSLRQALAHSNNVIAVKLLDAIGVPKFVDFASKMGLSLRGRNDLSLALGTAEVTLNELVSAYTSLADGGKRTESRTIVRIFERSRRTWTEIPPAVAPVLNPATAFVTTQMLKDVMIYGTAKKLKKFSEAHPSAGKTGTTDDYRDAWFVGYTPQIITGVWVGYDKPKPGGKGFTGGAVSAPIWERFMRKALAARPAVGFPRPDGVVTVRIDPFTDQLATPNCPVTREEFYIAGTEPTKYCSRHGGDSLETGGAVAPLPAALEEKSSPPPDDNLSPKQNQKEQPGESLPGQ
jgi:1A family penicillin-binding protein